MGKYSVMLLAAALVVVGCNSPSAPFMQKSWLAELATADPAKAQQLSLALDTCMQTANIPAGAQPSESQQDQVVECLLSVATPLAQEDKITLSHDVVKSYLF